MGQPSRIYHGETHEKGRIDSCDAGHLMQRKLKGFVGRSGKTVVPQCHSTFAEKGVVDYFAIFHQKLLVVI